MPRYIGVPVKRPDDGRLVTGRGRYVDDLRQPGVLHLAFTRSTHAHARVLAVDLEAARAVPGVEGAFTAADLGDLGNVPCTPFVPGIRVPPQPPMASDRVRFVGELLAAVAAETRYQAEDGARAVQVEYEPLPAVVDAAEALADGAPSLHENAPGNLAYRVERRGGDVEAAFDRAARVVRARARHSRIAAVAMEPRGLLAVPQADGELTVYVSHQAPHALRSQIAAAVELPEHRVRVVVPDVGGGFGVKTFAYREDLVACRIALLLARPVKWHATRFEDLASTSQARDQQDEIEAAFDEQGHLLGLRTRTVANLGAYLFGRGSRPPLRVPDYVSGAYRVASQASEVVAAYTNTGSTAPYRGAGRPEAAFLIERLMDTAARELAVDPAELRRRNFVRPDDFPHRTPTGVPYDSGDYPRLLTTALAAADYDAWRAERDRRRAAGELVGIGLATFIENTAAGWESGSVRVEPDGSVTLLSGSNAMGQGITTALAQIVAERLGVEFERVRVLTGDTALVETGFGSFGSRSTALGGSAAALAADRVIEKALRIGAHLLEAPPEDLEYVEGAVRIKGAPERGATLAQLARAAHPGMTEGVPFEPGLAASATFAAEAEAIASGAYLALASVDRETGRVSLERLVACDDSGVVINPLLVAGQVMGGIGQGIGEALTERLVYDETGQLLTGSLLDYALPTAAGVPDAVLAHIETPSPRNPLGVKGAGEAGVLGAVPAIVNAVADALAPLGVREVHPPLTSERVWRWMREAGSSDPG